MYLHLHFLDESCVRPNIIIVSSVDLKGIGCIFSFITENTVLHLIQTEWNTVEPRYLELAYFELPLISKGKSGPCFNMKLWQQVTK